MILCFYCLKKFLSFNVNKNPTRCKICRYLFTAKSLYMFRVSQHPSSGVLKTVTATSGTGHNTGTATSLQHGLIRPRWSEDAVPEAAVTVFSTKRNRYNQYRTHTSKATQVQPKQLHTCCCSTTYSKHRSTSNFKNKAK